METPEIEPDHPNGYGLLFYTKDPRKFSWARTGFSTNDVKSIGHLHAKNQIIKGALISYHMKI